MTLLDLSVYEIRGLLGAGVDVTVSENPSFGKPRALFEGSSMFGKTEGQEFDVSPDGRRFLMLTPQQPLTATPLNVRVNWFNELRPRASR